VIRNVAKGIKMVMVMKRDIIKLKKKNVQDVGTAFQDVLRELYK